MGYIGTVEMISTDNISNWEYRDRKKFELGNIKELAESIQNNGQAQPVVLVETSDVFKAEKNSNTKYVVIAGYRRWLACKLIKQDIQAIVKKLSFEDAIACVVDENSKQGVSDYSKGMFYYNVLQSKKITQEQLSQKLMLPLSSLKHYLAFSRIPNDIIQAIGDLSLVSARTAVEIAALSKKGKEYYSAVVALAQKISCGYGEKRIKKEIEKYLQLNQENKNIVQNSRVILSGEKRLAKITKGTIKFEQSVINNEKYKNFEEEIEKLITKYFG